MHHLYSLSGNVKGFLRIFRKGARQLDSACCFFDQHLRFASIPQLHSKA